MKTSESSRRTWRVVEFQVDKRQEELAGWLMMQQGANGCEVFPEGDAYVRIRATFEEDKLPGGDTTALSAALDEYGLNLAIPTLRTSELMEEDWLTKWKEGFEPFPVGDKILISPLWDKDKLTDEQKNGRAVVLIEPGLAFGTGFHETTRFCLLALQDYVGNAKDILDVGSGSGILSIAAALLNDKAKIIAVENDPVACKNSIENFESNNVVNRIELIEGTTQTLKERHVESFDLVLANMTYEDHVALLSDYLSIMLSGCHILFAGILKEKKDLMRDLMQKHGLQVVREDVGNAWVGFVGKKP